MWAYLKHILHRQQIKNNNNRLICDTYMKSMMIPQLMDSRLFEIEMDTDLFQSVKTMFPTEVVSFKLKQINSSKEIDVSTFRKDMDLLGAIGNFSLKPEPATR
jgi:hypothetical protein